jgi:hypothetical protein
LAILAGGGPPAVCDRLTRAGAAQVQWADAARPVLQLQLTAGSQAGTVFCVPPHLSEVRPHGAGAATACAAVRWLRSLLRRRSRAARLRL